MVDGTDSARHQCEGTVSRGHGGGFGSRQCLRTAIIHERGEWFCHSHSPSKRSERAERSETARAVDSDARRRLYAARRDLIHEVRLTMRDDPNALPEPIMLALIEYDAAARGTKEGD